jgi:hypothetical protein
MPGLPRTVMQRFPCETVERRATTSWTTTLRPTNGTGGGSHVLGMGGGDSSTKTPGSASSKMARSWSPPWGKRRNCSLSVAACWLLPVSVRAAVVATSKACRTVRPMTMERSDVWGVGGGKEGSGNKMSVRSFFLFVSGQGVAPDLFWIRFCSRGDSQKNSAKMLAARSETLASHFIATTCPVRRVCPESTKRCWVLEVSGQGGLTKESSPHPPPPPKKEGPSMDIDTLVKLTDSRRQEGAPHDL